MTAVKGLVVGLVFGLVLCWSGMSSPEVIRGALLFKDSYLYLMFASAVLTAAVGLQVLKRVAGASWTPERPERRHVAGAALFGLGWGIANVCPGPIATQLGMGIAWGYVTAIGATAGVWLFVRRGARETEPASDAELPAGTQPVPAG